MRPLAPSTATEISSVMALRVCRVTMGAVDLDAAMAALYALAPDAFLPRRAEMAADARSHGNRDLANEIRRLRKPSVAAWAVNRMVQTHPNEVAALTDLAARLRSAQESLDGAQLQTLGRERTKLVDALVRATIEAAGEEGPALSAAAARDAADTFVAALADPQATAAVVSGRLTRTLSYAGFGDVDLTEATARPLRAVPRSGPGSGGSPAGNPPEPGDQRLDAPGVPPGSGAATRADPAVPGAEARLRAAIATATDSARRRSVLAAELELAETRVAHLSREIARARAHRDATADALASAEVADGQAQTEVRAAQATANAARDSSPGTHGSG
ncbi:MAG: hypothetical protein ACOYBY_12715 [Dermatophilaceae bacterium]